MSAQANTWACVAKVGVRRCLPDEEPPRSLHLYHADCGWRANEATPERPPRENERSVLSFLAEHGPASQSEINDHFHAEASAEVRSLLASGEIVYAARNEAPS